MNFEVRPALPEEYQLVADIGRRSFYETWKPVNTEEDLQAYIKESFSDEKIRADLMNDEFNTFLLAFHEQTVAGYAKLRSDRTYAEFSGQPAIEMERIYVLKKFQDRKAGKALMDESLRIARSGNYTWFWLGVNQENYKAINFYRRYGLEIFGTKKFQLGSAVDEDYLMKLRI